jgi:hypothetical protein
MSLRAIHIVVISASILLLFLFGFWALKAPRVPGGGVTLVWGAVSIAAGAALSVYLAWFITKIKRTGSR